MARALSYNQIALRPWGWEHLERTACPGAVPRHPVRPGLYYRQFVVVEVAVRDRPGLQAEEGLRTATVTTGQLCDLAS